MCYTTTTVEEWNSLRRAINNSASGVPRSRLGPVFRRGVPQRSSPPTTRRGWTSWLYRQYRHARSTGKSLGRLVDEGHGVHGHGQFCHPLAMYKPHDLLDWLTHHFEGFESNGHAIQAVDSQACGLHALMFLIHMSVGGTLDTFMNIFNRHDFVKNDRRVAQWFQHLVERDMTWHRFKQFRQANHVPVRLLDMVMLQ